MTDITKERPTGLPTNEELLRDQADLVARAQAQPGLAELMAVFGAADQVVRDAQTYLAVLAQPRSMTWSSDTTLL